MTTAAMNKNAKIVDPGNASDIQSLTVKSQDLGKSVDDWNNGYVWLGAGALLVAFLVFFAQWQIIRKGRQLSLVTTSLLSAKDRKLEIELHNKDVDIAEVTDKASAATERAAKAEERAGKAELGAATALDDADRAKRDAARAELELANAHKEAAIANQMAAEATKIAEQERIERLKLEAQVNPRRLTMEQGGEVVAALKRFKGKKVLLKSYSSDAESAVLASQLVLALQSAEIQVDDRSLSVVPFGSIELGIHVTGSDTQFAQDLVSILQIQGKLAVAPFGTSEPAGPGASISAWTANNFQPDAIIFVGAKPLAY